MMTDSSPQPLSQLLEQSALIKQEPKHSAISSRNREAVQALLVAFSPTRQMDMCKNTNDCFFGEYPTLAALNKNCGEGAAEAWLIPQLTDLFVFCGQQGDKIVFKATAMMIAREYYFLKVSELMLFFYKFKAGAYGKIYGNIKAVDFMFCLRQFATERVDAYQKKESEEHLKLLDKYQRNAISYTEYLARKEKEKQM